ncbi:MAG: hypothetical protein AAFQ78_02895, partial [Bacteroidota bacterium]
GKGTGHKNNHSHTHRAINVGGNPQLKDKKDIKMSGTHMHTQGDVSGTVGGNIAVETITDTISETQRNVETSLGISAGVGGFGPNISGGCSYSNKNGNLIKQQSAFTSGGRFKVSVGDKVEQMGAQVGSLTSGQQDIYARGGIHKEDVYSDYTETNFGINTRLGARYTGRPNSAVEEEPAYASLNYGTKQQISQAACNGQTTTIADTGTELSVDTEAIKAVATPVDTFNDIVRDTQAVYSAGEGIVHTFAANKKDKDGKRGLGARGVLKGIQNSCEDAAGLHTTSKDEETTETINNATETDAKELQKTLDKASKKLQAHAGIQGEQQADLQLYQGNKEGFQNSPLKGYKAAYDVDKNKIYFNTQSTDLSRGGDIMGSLHHEAQRRENQSSQFLSTLSDKQQTNLAKLRGQQAARTWNRISGANRTTNATANDAWNRRNQASLKNSNNLVAGHGEVKPREYNFDYRTGKFSYVSPEGGNQRHPINFGTTDEEGNFVPLKKETVEGDGIIATRFY